MLCRTDHLGNVHATVSDRRIYDTTLEASLPEVQSLADYFPFGMQMPGKKLNPERYRYGFNGGEKINEVYGEGNYVDLGERGVDVRLGRLNWSIDPRTAEYPWQSTYAYFGNSPISQLDYNGEGDYYNTDGKHLGSDNKTIEVDGKQVPDNKVYTSDGINDDGSFKNVVDLNISHTNFAISANVVNHESSGDKTESLWIAHTANNAKDNNAVDYKRKNSTLYDQITDQQYSTTPDMARTPLSPTNSSNAANNARAAVINVLTGGKDPTNGSVLWDGDDFLKKGTTHPKFKEYTSVNISANDLQTYIFKPKRPGKGTIAGTFWSEAILETSYSEPGNSSRGYSLNSNGAQGRTIFWKLGKK